MADASAPLTVLIVDDDEAVRRVLHQFLTKSGYQALEASNGRAALDQLEAHRVAAVVCDIIMPGMTGIELVPIAIERDPDLAIIMLTGVDNPQSAIQCLKNGAADYLIKPVDLEELAHALQYALRKRELEIERRSLEEWLTREVALRTRDLEEQKRQIEALSVTVLTALVEALEKPGPGGRTHSVRVANLSSQLASQLGIDSDEIEPIRIAARLHDIGQLALREDVLRETSQRTKELVGAPEGPELAARILQPLSGHAGVIAIVRRQHERWDGRGKPDGLKGDAIPLGARIIAAANLYDELTATVEEEKALSPAQAMENLRGLAGMLLDPRVLKALEQVVGERR
ncbi:MAG: response regulator [Gemmatimonadales bacterium]|nr:response regulator [Gemmatimonadales bacterium]